MDELQIDVQEVAWHRNGIGGIGFYAVRFMHAPDGCSDAENFLGIVFDEPGCCAVIGLDRINDMGVAFARGNSWRGDRFEGPLRHAIETEPLSGGIRVGPFCVPVDADGDNDS